MKVIQINYIFQKGKFKTSKYIPAIQKTKNIIFHQIDNELLDIKSLNFHY